MLGRRRAIEDLHFVARQRLADGAHHDIVRRSDAGTAGGFGHAVGLQHGEAHSLKLAPDGRIEARAAGDEVAHVEAEQLVDFSEEHFAEVDVKLAGEVGDAEHDAEDGADEQRLSVAPRAECGR